MVSGPAGHPDAGRRHARFLAGAGLLVLAYLVAAPVVWSARGFDGDAGPLAFRAPEATSAPPDATVTLAAARAECEKLIDLSGTERVRVAAGTVSGQPLFACYGLRSNGDLIGAVVLDGAGNQVHNVPLIKQSGARRWIGLVTTRTDLVTGGLAMVAFPALCYRYYRRPRPGPLLGGGLLQSRWTDGVLAVLGPLGWAVLAVERRRSRGRKIRVVRCP